jgi:hypothetical protein
MTGAVLIHVNDYKDVSAVLENTAPQTCCSPATSNAASRASGRARQ